MSIAKLGGQVPWGSRWWRPLGTCRRHVPSDFIMLLCCCGAVVSGSASASATIGTDAVKMQNQTSTDLRVQDNAGDQSVGKSGGRQKTKQSQINPVEESQEKRSRDRKSTSHNDSDTSTSDSDVASDTQKVGGGDQSAKTVAPAPSTPRHTRQSRAQRKKAHAKNKM